MFNPTKVWRRWHRKINVNQRRYALVSALAASAIPALVMARGHRVGHIPEVPLVVSNELEEVKKTQKALAALRKIGAIADVHKVKASRALRRGKGKSRNRRWTQRRGPLIIYNRDHGIVRAFRNIPGVETCCVKRLNLLQLAPGGHLGRFCIWTHDAFRKLHNLYGSYSRSASLKSNYQIPHAMMTHADLTRIINSDEIQAVIRPKRQPVKFERKRNPLRSLQTMHKLNPFLKTLIRRRHVLKEAKKKAEKKKPTPRKPSKLSKEEKVKRNKSKRILIKRKKLRFKALHA
jgi:large subunit ribosomal protein L4e